MTFVAESRKEKSLIKKYIYLCFVCLLRQTVCYLFSSFYRCEIRFFFVVLFLVQHTLWHFLLLLLHEKVQKEVVDYVCGEFYHALSAFSWASCDFLSHSILLLNLRVLHEKNVREKFVESFQNVETFSLDFIMNESLLKVSIRK